MNLKNSEFWEVLSVQDVAEIKECQACALDRAAAEGKTTPLMAYRHTCKDRFDIYEKTLVLNDMSRFEEASRVLMAFIFEKYPNLEYFKLRLTDSVKHFNAKELIIQWAVER
jgi:hypothetical protein